MFLRLLFAVIGAVTITVTMLLTMSEFSTMFRERSGDRFFLINDILPAPERGRPTRPPAAALPPGRAPADYEAEDSAIPIEGLSVPRERLGVRPIPSVPRLESDDPSAPAETTEAR